jgi:isocitrate dehydrogenase
MKNSKSIQMEEGKLNVPNYPIIPFIEGDGIGSDIWKASVHVFDNAIHKAYGDSNTCTEAFHMSEPIPSPSINGIIG